jgi:NADH-quinone oxidoreductase subunit L
MSDYSGQVTHVEPALAPLWLIPLLPFLGTAANAVFGRTLQKSAFGKDLAKRLHTGSFGVTLVAVGAMLGAFALGAANFIELLTLDPGHRYLVSHAWQMVRIGSFDANFAFAMDPLSAVMTLIITGVGSLIHIYAASYMENEPAYWRFFTYLNLFVFSMLLLVLGDNFIVMFFGWEGVGLCSYLLIGFWYKDYKKATAGMKAFVVNRVGDWGFICGLSLLFWGLGGAWLDQGRYNSDYLPRFIAVQAEELAHDDAGAHGATDADKPGGDKAAEHKAAHAPKDANSIPSRGKGQLTFTAYPGARVYLGIADQAQLALGPPVFGISPFIRKEVPAGLHSIVVVPGDGATVGGDGNEVALIEHAMIAPGKETLIMPVGPTVTFRELHDQMVVKDASGAAFLKEAAKSKTVWGGISLITLACLLFFVGATGKSAQIPLFVWLPDAMAGPTPVSALIHAATMVTAGVYMIARLSFLFSLSPTASGVVAFVGAATALFAATIGLFQYDIKKVLAYSTVSQLGFMFIGVGAGAYWAAVFHLMTHAFFKACLFLGSGSVIHGMHAVEHDEVAVQDMRNMGGLRRVMPLTARTYQIACLAITAAPIPFFAGFWSKDEILWKAFGTQTTGPFPGVLIYLMGLTAALCTSFYMWRSYYLTFEGPHARKEIATKVKESPPAITYVLAILAFLSAFTGVAFGFATHFVGGHGHPLLESWLHPTLAHAETRFKPYGLGLEYLLMAVSVGGALLSWSIARARYGDKRDPSWAKEEEKLPGFHTLYNKYFVDEIYDKYIVQPFMALRLVLAEMDRWIVDGIVNGVGVAARGAAWVSGAIDTYIVDGAVNFVAEGTLKAGNKLRALQTGRVQNYVYGLLGGVAFFSIVQYFLK